jgi:hypothetical protein
MKNNRLIGFTIVLIVTLLLGCLPVHAAPPHQGRRDLVACTAVDETYLLEDLNTITQTVFVDALTRVDVASIVNRQWRTLRMDNTLRTAIDRAVETVQSNTDLWTTFLSGWSTDKAQELTLSVASAAFDDPAFRTAMNQLSNAVAADIAGQIGEISAESVSAGLYCLQTFISANYSQALLASFDEKVQIATSADGLNTEGLAPSLLNVISQHKSALGGVGVIIAAQITRRLVREVTESIAERVVGRIAGRVLGRIGTTVIPLAGWIIGAGLIAYDIYDSLDGALPQIQESLKAPEVAEAIRSQISETIEPELALELPTVARRIANDLHSQWLSVKRDIRVILEMAAESDAFADVLQQTQSTEDLSRLVAVVGAALPGLGREGVIQAAENGVLSRVIALPGDPSAIIAATGSMENAAAWGDAAGVFLEQVIATELYKHLSPADVDRSLLQGLFSLADNFAIERLALLPIDQIRALLTVAEANLTALVKSLTPEELGWLAETLVKLDQSQRNLLIARLVSQPETLALIKESDLLSALNSTHDFDAAVEFLARPRDVMGLLNDAATVLAGGASVRLFIMKHGWGVTLLIGLTFVLLVLIMLRLIYSLGAWLFAPVTGLLGKGR